MNSDDFQRYVAAKGINTTCSSCGDDRWYLINEPVQLHGKPALVQNRVIYAYLLTCLNCGNARTYIQTVVDQWLSENPESPT